MLFDYQVGSTCVTLGVLPRSSAGGGGRGGTEAIKLALQAVVPVPSSKVQRNTFVQLQSSYFPCHRFAISTSRYVLSAKLDGASKRCAVSLACIVFAWSWLIASQVVAECKAFAADGSQKSLPLNASNVLNQPTCKVHIYFSPASLILLKLLFSLIATASRL